MSATGLLANVFEHGAQGFQIAVDIADQRDLHLTCLLMLCRSVEILSGFEPLVATGTSSACCLPERKSRLRIRTVKTKMLVVIACSTRKINAEIAHGTQS